MAEHAQDTDTTPAGNKGTEGATEVMPPARAAEPEPRQHKRADVDWKRVKDRTVGLVASVVRWLGLIFAAILVLHIIFVIGEATRDNSIVSFVRGWADSLVLGFQNMFEIADDPKLQVLVNYGLAAVFWLVVSLVVAKIVRRVGGA